MTTTQSYYRVQTADRDADQLLDPASWTSISWSDETDEQHGVSVCESREALATYLAATGIPIGDGHWVLVELTGHLLPTRGHDAHLGELLVEPDAVVSVTEIDDQMWDMIGAAFDAQS